MSTARQAEGGGRPVAFGCNKVGRTLTSSAHQTRAGERRTFCPPTEQKI